MHSLRTKITSAVVTAIIIALGIATLIGVISIKRLGSQDADQMLPLRLRTISFPDGQYSSVSIRLLPRTGKIVFFLHVARTFR